MKLFIFPIWQGYVCMEYYPIVADTEKEAREVIRELCMPKWIEETKHTSDFIRTEYGKYENRYPRTGTSYHDHDHVYNSAEEEADYYYKTMIEEHEAQIASSNDVVAVELPLKDKGFIKDLFHMFQE